MTTPPEPAETPPSPDELNRLWQHSLHEERLFHDRMHFFTAMQVGLLGVFAVLYNKEPSFRVFVPLTVVSLALTLLWLAVQTRHWSYCVHLNTIIRQAVPEYRRTIATRESLGRKDGLFISRPLAYAVPLLFATVWVALFAAMLAR